MVVSDQTGRAVAEGGTAGADGGGAERARAYRAARRHSHLVRILRVLFPVLAFGSLGLFAVGARWSATVGDATASVEAIRTSTKDLTMVDPRLEGETADKGRYLVKAATAVQDFSTPDLIRLKQIDARLTRPGNEWATIRADTGNFATKAEKLDLAGNIVVVSSNGMRARMTTAHIDVASNRIISWRPVRVEMLNSRIDAEAMDVSTKNRTIAFTGGVKVRLRKQPAKSAGAAN